MNYILVAFKSRSNLLALYNKLKKYGVYSSLVNTPSSVSQSCGLSLKTNRQNLNLIVNLLQQGSMVGFLGIFFISRNGFREIAERIY